jgi:hypothetical protein
MSSEGTPAAPEPQPAASEASPRTLPRWRRILVGFLVVLGCVLTPLSILSVWVHNTLLDTDQWVATVGPLIEQPAVQEAVANRVTDAVIEGSDLERKVRSALPSAAKGLAPLVAEGGRQAVDAATLKIVSSDRFGGLWDTVNRRAHSKVVAVLQGEGTETVATRNGEVVLKLGPIVGAVAQELSDRGIGLFDDVTGSRVDRDIVIFSSSDLSTAQGLVDLLDKLAIALPIATLVVFAAAIALSGNRRRTILRGALGVALAMGIVLTAFNLGRAAYLDALPESVNRAAAQDVYDQVLTFLRTSLRTTFWIAIVIAIGAWLVGAGRAAVRVRETVGRALDRSRVEDAAPAPLAGFVAHYRNVLRVLVIGLGLVILMAIDHPRPLSVLIVLVVVLIGLAVVEILGRAAPTPPPTDRPVGAA